MARGRLISRCLGTSRKFAALSDECGKLAEFAQALYPLIVANTDDFGRFDGDAFTIKHAVWPTSPRSLPDFEKALEGMARVGLIQRYTTDAHGICLQVENFREHQPGLHKATKSRFPEPTGMSGNFPEIPSEGKGREEEGEEEEEGKDA